MSALDVQEGGGHYKDMPIQVVEFCQKNRLNYCEANMVKYACRWRNKNGLEDLKKIKHYVDLLIELEGLEEEKFDPISVSSVPEANEINWRF